MTISDVLSRISEIQGRFGVSTSGFRLGPDAGRLSEIALAESLPIVQANVGSGDVASQLAFQRSGLGLSTASPMQMVDPVGSGRVSSLFGPRSDPFTGETRQHKGIDVAAPTGTPIVASAPGTVTWAGERGSYGELVIVDHGGGVESRYAHQAWIDVAVGDEVAAGEVIGAVGSTGRSTGPHLHYEIRVNGEAVDPRPWFAAAIGRSA